MTANELCPDKVSIEVNGKQYELRITVASFKFLEKHFGKFSRAVEKMYNMDDPSIEEIEILLAAATAHMKENMLTVDELDGIDMVSLMKYFQALRVALVNSMPTQEQAEKQEIIRTKNGKGGPEAMK